MEAAKAAPTKVTLSANKAANLHGAPWSTLKDRWKSPELLLLFIGNEIEDLLDYDLGGSGGYNC